MEDLILKHAILNAVEHNGKAEMGAVIGKVVAERPELRSSIKDIVPEVKRIVDDVNGWGLEKQREEMIALGLSAEKKVQRQGLPELHNAKRRKVVMRLAPYPSGPLHIGNARVTILNDEYVKRYKGKLILVIDDTIGSEEKFIIPEAYRLIPEGLKWLGVKTTKPIYKSDRLKIFYKYAEQMIGRGMMYVCACSAEELRRNRLEGLECACRNYSTKQNLVAWRKMLSGKYREGQAVVRLKTDMAHPNPAFRDRVMLRIAERRHPRVGKKYKVWPMLEFSWAIDDHELGVTHVLRGKDLIIEDMVEGFIWDKMGWKKAEFVHYGLLNIKEAKLSKSKSRMAIDKGEYSGWEDPRTWSMQSLARRGIRPEAIRKFIVGMGMSLADVVIPAEILYAENRKIIDAEANRYFAVLDPVEIYVDGAPKMKAAEAPVHPDFPRRGKRRIPLRDGHIHVERADFERLYGKDVGLMNLYTIRMERIDGKVQFLSKEIRMEDSKIHWVSEPNVKAKIVMPDGNAVEAIAEPCIKKAKAGSMVQLVRVGFCRVGKIGKEIVLYFSHK